MAFTTLTVQRMPPFASGITQTVVDNTNGNRFLNNGGVWMLFTGTGACTVTINLPNADDFVFTLADTDIVVFRPLPKSIYNQPGAGATGDDDGFITMTFTTANATLALWQ